MSTASRRILMVLALVGGLFLLLLGWFGYSLFGPGSAIVVSPETTYLTEPLAADGLPDYGRALLERQREGVTPENNGAIPFWQAMWPGELSPRDQVLLLNELGMNEPEPGIAKPYDDHDLWRELMLVWLIDQGHHQTAEQLERQDESEYGGTRPGEHVDPELPIGQAYQQTERWLYGMQQPWTARQIPPLADWVQDNEPFLDLLIEAGHRPRFYSPSPSLLDGQEVPLLEILLPSLPTIRLAVRMLNTRAMLHTGEGRYEDAWRDLRGGYALAEHLSDQHFVLHELVSIACFGIADEATLHLLSQPDLDGKIARQVLDHLRKLKRRNAMASAIDQGERFSNLDTIIHLSQGDTGVLGDPSADGLTNVLAFNWNIVLRETNELNDRLVAAGRLENWQDRQSELERFENDLAALQPSPGAIMTSVFSRNRRSRMLSILLNEMLLSAMTIGFDAEERANARRDLMRVAAALAVYRTEHGTYPDVLEALVPQVLEELPVDLFHRQPFRYGKTEHGYLLYSLGPNGSDDGGSHEKFSVYQGYSLQNHDDAVIRALLGEADVPEAEPGDDEQADDRSLDEAIPSGADDHAIRLPLPVVSLPTPFSDKAGASVGE